MPNPRFGFHRRILHVDLGNSSTRVETPEENFYRIYAGGGLLGAYYLLQHTPAALESFDPRNLLIFASSVIAGIRAPGLARFSVIGKSPLSGGIAEARSEGPWGIALKESGFDAIVIHGRAVSPVYLLVDPIGVRIHAAQELWGHDTGQTTDALVARHGISAHVAAIGPAGERLVRFASVVTDRCFMAARGGVGAVMGSKNLKAIVLNRSEAPAVSNPSLLERLAQNYEKRIPQNVLSRMQKEPPGHAFDSLLDLSGDLLNPSVETPGYTAVENFRTSINHRKALDGAAFMPFLVWSEGGCPGCPSDCTKGFASPQSKDRRAIGIGQETVAVLGANLGVTDAATILDANTACHLLGLDPVSTGFTLSFVMECRERGLIDPSRLGGLDARFGDSAAIGPLIESIAYRRGAGDWLAEGVKRVCDRIVPDAKPFAMHVKGVELGCVEPRFQANVALGYAVSPTGPRYDLCEHDWDFDTESGWKHSLENARAIGILERLPMAELSAAKVQMFRALSNLWSACDALNLCIFASAPTRIYTLPQMSELVEAVTGWETSGDELMRWGERRIHLMRAYNLREGLSVKDDWLPDRFFREPIDTGRFRGLTLDGSAFRQSILQYYDSMGWDESGVPRAATLLEHHLDWVTS